MRMEKSRSMKKEMRRLLKNNCVDFVNNLIVDFQSGFFIISSELEHSLNSEAQIEIFRSLYTLSRHVLFSAKNYFEIF